MTGILNRLLAIAARGGLKLGVTILTVALFTAIITGTQNIISSYSVNAPIIEEMATQPALLIHGQDNGESLKVLVADALIEGAIVMVVSPSNITEYLALMGAKSESKQPEPGKALISGDLLPSTVNGSIKVADIELQVAGSIEPFEGLSRTLIVSNDTLQTLNIENESFYYERYTAETRGQAEAPSSISLIQGLTFEVQSLLSTIMYIMYVSLGLTCLIQAFYVVNESKDVLKVFQFLGSSNRGIFSSLTAMAAVVSAVSIVLGYAFGAVASASASALVSLALDLPYIKPMVSDALFRDLALAFISSSIGLSAGYARGYIAASLG